MMGMSAEVHRLRLGMTNCYLLEGRKHILVDTGTPHKSKAFQRQMDELGLDAGKVDLIIITHAHFDHAGSLAAIKDITGARCLVHADERQAVETGWPPFPQGNTTAGRAMCVLFRLTRPFSRFKPASVEIETEDAWALPSKYGFKGRVVHTPGHTGGSVSLVLEGGNAFTGDLVLARGSGVNSRPPLGIGQQYFVSSWRRLLDMGARTIYPAHGRPMDAVLLKEAVARV